MQQNEHVVTVRHLEYFFTNFNARNSMTTFPLYPKLVVHRHHTPHSTSSSSELTVLPLSIIPEIDYLAATEVSS